jgi:hypothetical protein
LHWVCHKKLLGLTAFATQLSNGYFAKVKNRNKLRKSAIFVGPKLLVARRFLTIIKTAQIVHVPRVLDEVRANKGAQRRFGVATDQEPPGDNV